MRCTFAIMHPKLLTLIEMSKNQPPHFLCVTWILLRLMAPAIRAAPSVLLKHCYYLGKCQGRPGSHLIFCLPKTAANALKKQKKSSSKCAPHWQEARQTESQNVALKWKTGNHAICFSISVARMYSVCTCSQSYNLIFWSWL